LQLQNRKMKYFFLLFMAGITVVSCTNTDKTSDVAKETRDSMNQIVMKDTSSYTTIEWIDSTHQSLGSVEEGQVLDISWKFRNSGNKALVISDVRPGCGCTITEYPLQPIAPGKEERIRAKFNSANQHPGMAEKSVTVIANTKGETNHMLGFQVMVTKK
jgi:hypothetical protein